MIRTARTAFAALLLVLAVAGVAACSGTATPSAAEALVGAPAPALSGDSLTGDGSLDLASMTGKPTVVVFWLNTCPHCQAFVPAFQAAWPQVADKANVLLAGMQHPDPNVPAGPGFETTEAFVATTGLTLPTISADLEQETTDWRFDQVPAVFLLDADHVVRDVMIGPEASEVIEALSAM